MGMLALTMAMYYRTYEAKYSFLSLVAIYAFGIIFATGYTSMQVRLLIHADRRIEA